MLKKEKRRKDRKTIKENKNYKKNNKNESFSILSKSKSEIFIAEKTPISDLGFEWGVEEGDENNSIVSNTDKSEFFMKKNRSSFKNMKNSKNKFSREVKFPLINFLKTN